MVTVAETLKQNVATEPEKVPCFNAPEDEPVGCFPQ
jgi:hypothetical protein